LQEKRSGKEGIYTNKTENIISCYGNVNNKSTARMIGVSRPWVTFVWQRAGCGIPDDE
jgi:hypothetical protein